MTQHTTDTTGVTANREPVSTPLQTSVSGFPRIGAHRELKRVIERYWKGECSIEEVRAQAQELRRTHWQLQVDAGIDFIPSNDFSLYDQVLDTAVLLNAVPQRYTQLQFEQPEDTYFAVTRGYQGEHGDIAALPMKKWFTTNYHYIVPEIESVDQIAVTGTKPFDEFIEAKNLGITTKPVLIGPFTFLKLARDASNQPLAYDERTLTAFVKSYVEIIVRFQELGAPWVQLDEPWLAHGVDEADLNALRAIYEQIVRNKGAVKVLVNTYFGHIADSYKTLVQLGIDGIGLDFVEGRQDNLDILQQVGVPQSVTLFAGVVSGRNIWRNNYELTLGMVDQLRDITQQSHANLVIATGCSLLHVPYTVELETQLDSEITQHFAFAQEKLGELVQLGRLAVLSATDREKDSEHRANRSLHSGNRVATDEQIRNQVQQLDDSDFVRLPHRQERLEIQQQEFNLPLLPTTTIGSFPQTAQVRKVRAQYRKHELTDEQYTQFIQQQIDEVIAHQERIGLDVLVHGEFERNDMVEYFGQHLNGYVFTQFAWVQSYGTRCVKPPVIYGDVSRREPITVAWSEYAQAQTTKLVKGMLTGPVTILNWSWPREDITQRDQALQIGLAIRDEVLDLQKHGIRIIQIDEAALREKLPLRRSQWHSEYLDWAIAAFRLVHSKVDPTTQIHTHMCYSEFNDIITDIDAMDADVISFEASRGELVVLDAIVQSDFHTQVGPGVYDIHSPRVPAVEELAQRIRTIVSRIDSSQVWVNPDCGLKTRGNQETWPALEHMVEAAVQVRQELQHSGK